MDAPQENNEDGSIVKTKPVRVREEIPEFEDPSAELAKLNTEMIKPDRSSLDEKINKFQAVIDAQKRTAERITKDLDAIKDANSKRKQQGSGEMETVRNKLRDIKSSIVGTIEEKKLINAQIEAIRNAKRAMEDQVKAARASAGNFKSNEQIDDAIAQVQDQLHHHTNTIREEKALIQRIKELEACRESVKDLEKLEGKTGDSKTSSAMPELFEARNAKDEIINALKVKESAQVEILEALKAKREKEMASNNFSELFEQRNKCRDTITENITAIRELRDAFKKEEDAFYKNDRLIRELKRQISRKNREAKQKAREEWIKQHGEDGEGAPDAEEEDEEDENGEKPMCYEIAERIATCEQLIVFLQGYQRKETKVEEKKAVDPSILEGARGKGMSGQSQDDDPLGLNAFMVEEAVSSKKSKKDKKKAKAQAKKSNVPEEGEVIALNLSLDMIHNFTVLALPTPINTDDVAAGIEGLTAKKQYYEEKGKTGIKLKELIKQEKEAKRAAKNGGKLPEEVKAQEEANFQKSKEASVEQAAAETKKPTRDFGAEKLARKAAEMPEVDPDIDLAALRAKAQGAKMSDEEKKARGLLYDTSKASAIRDEPEEDDEGACDFDGGFDWDMEGGDEEKVSGSPDPIDDKFEAYMREQGLDEDDDDEEEEVEEAPEFPPHVTPSGLKFQMKLNTDATVSFEITQLAV